MAEVAAAPGAAARTAATAASAGTAIGDAVVGIVRFSVDHGDADADAAAPDEAGSEGHDPVVVVDIVPADPDRPPGRRDLVAAVRYL
jgi:hypothetical protein